MSTDNRLTRRQFLRLFVVGAAVASVVAACGRAPSTTTPKEGEPKPAETTAPGQAPAAGGAKVTLPYSAFDSFDHAFWTAQLRLSQGTIFEGLFGYDDKLNIIPKVAESSEHSDDYKVWTYKLRKDKKWANGDPVTAKDFYNSWMRFMGPELKDTPMWAGAWGYINNSWAYKSGAAKPEEVGLKLVDDYTLEVTLNRAYPSFSSALVMAQAMPIHSKTLEEHPTDWWDPKYGAYNGPFIVKEWVAGGETTLTRNPNYVGDRYGNVDTIVLQIFGDANARLQAFENGELQYSGLDDASQVTYIQNNAQLKEGYREELSINWAGLQFDRADNDGPFAKPEVRKAFAMAVDKKAITEQVMKGLAVPATAFTGDQEIAKQIKPLEFNPTEAKKLLADAGYSDPSKLGEVMIYAPPANSREMPLVEAVAKMWQENLGVKVTIQSMESGPYSSMQWSNETKDITPGYIPMGGAMNFFDPMGLYQNVGHIWWFMDFSTEWKHVKYWKWDEAEQAVDKLTEPGDFAELTKRAETAWAGREKIIAAENNDWGKSMQIPPTFKEQFDKIAERFNSAKDDAEKLTAYKDGLLLVVKEERDQDNYASRTDMNREAQRLMISLEMSGMEDAAKYLVPLNQLAVDSAWMVPIYVGKITYVVDPKLSGIVQNKLSWGDIFQFQYLNYAS